MWSEANLKIQREATKKKTNNNLLSKKGSMETLFSVSADRKVTGIFLLFYFYIALIITLTDGPLLQEMMKEASAPATSGGD